MEYLCQILNTQNYADSNNNMNNYRKFDKYNLKLECDVLDEFRIDEGRLSSSTTSDCFSIGENDNDVFFDDDCDSLCDEVINEIFSPSNNNDSTCSIGDILGMFQ